MNLPWNRTRNRMRRSRGLLVAGIALAAIVLALPLMPSLRRYVRLESM